MKTFDFEKFKRNYFIGDLVGSLFGAFLKTIAIMGIVELLSLVMLVFSGLIDTNWTFVWAVLMLIMTVAAMVFFTIKHLKNCRKDFQEICDNISQYGKCEIIINYIGKLPKKKGTEFDVRFDHIYLYVRSKDKIAVKLTETISQVEVFTPDDKKVHVIAYVNLLPVINFNITRHWNVGVAFSDGTVLIIPVKSKKKGDLLADELIKAIKKDPPISTDPSSETPVSQNKMTTPAGRENGENSPGLRCCPECGSLEMSDTPFCRNCGYDFLSAKNEITTPNEPQKNNKDVAEPHFGSPLGMLRYNVEHRILRSIFFEKPEAMIGTLIQSKNAIFEIYDDAFKQSGINNPYSSDNFCVEGVKFDPNGLFMRIKLPKPEFFPLCYRIYLVCDLDFTHVEYYTIERGMEGGYFCKWDKNEAHHNICEIKDPDFEAQSELKEMLYNAEGIIIAGKFNENRKNH